MVVVVGGARADIAVVIENLLAEMGGFGSLFRLHTFLLLTLPLHWVEIAARLRLFNSQIDLIST